MLHPVLQKVENAAQHALTGYVRRHLPSLLALAYARLGNRGDAEKVAAEALRLVAERPLAVPGEALNVRLAGVVLDLCRDPHRAGIDARGVSASGAADERLADIRRKVLGLDTEARECLLLHHVAGLSVARVAELRARAAGVVREKLQRGEAVLGPAERRDLAAALAVGGDPEAQVRRVARTLADAGLVSAPAEPRDRSAGTVMASAAVLAVLVMLSLVALVQAFPRQAVRSFGSHPLPATTAAVAPAPLAGHIEGPRRGRSLQGVVRDAATGEPVRNFEVAWLARDDESPTFVGLADPSGRFQLAHLPEGKLNLLVRASGFVQASAVVPLDGAEARKPLAVKLERAVGFEGFVVDSSGLPLPDAQVFLGGLPLPYPPDEHAVARSDAQGRFRVGGLASKRIEITVARNGYVPGSTWVYPGAPEPYRIELQPGGRLEGTVTADGAPLANARVVASSGLIKTYRAEAFTGADGRYALEGLPPGRVRIRGEGTNGRRTLSAVDIVKDETVRLTIDFAQPTHTVEGFVTFRGRRPQRAQVEALVRTDSGEERWGPVVTDENGWYRLGPIPSGTTRLRVLCVSHDSRARKGECAIESRDGEVLRQDIDLSGRGVIEGQLAGLRPGQHARLYAYVGSADEVEIHPDGLQEAGRDAAARQLVGKNGAFRFEDLEEGEYTLLAIALTDESREDLSDAPTTSATVTVDTKRAARVNLTFTP